MKPGYLCLRSCFLSFALICLLCQLALPISAAIAPPGKARPSCALLADPAGELVNSPLYSLLENHLLQDATLTMLDRAEIARVLGEQQLSQLFSPEGVKERIATGQILKAEYLLLLQGGEPVLDPQHKTKFVRLIVSETTHGLRLLVRTLPWTADAEADAGALQAAVHEALHKYQQGIREICAVPPLVSRDLTHERDELQEDYARLVEQSLLEQDGVVVVELAEARAIAAEIALTGNPAGVERKLPLYFEGDYRFDGLGEQQRVTVSLTLRRGQQQLGDTQRAVLAPAAVGPYLLQQTSALLATALGTPLPAQKPGEEAAQLLKRAILFETIGNWKEALALLDASLLLAPEQPGPLLDAAKMCAEWMWAAHHVPFNDELFLRQATLAIGLQHRLRGYLDRYSRLVGRPEQDFYYLHAPTFIFSMWAMESFRGDMRRYGRANPALQELAGEYRRQYFDERQRLYALLEQHVYTEPAENRYLLQVLSANLGTGFGTQTEAMSEVFAADLRFIRLLLNYWIPGEIDNRYLAFMPQQFHPQELRSPEFAAFLAQVVGLLKDHPAAEIDKLVEDRRRALAPAAPLAALPPVVETAHFRLTQLALTVGDLAGRKITAPLLLRGWLPAGPGIDAVWDSHDVYLMKVKDQLQQIYALPEPPPPVHPQVLTACFDGRYLWVAVNQLAQSADGAPLTTPLMQVFDPVSLQHWTITAQDGLPPMENCQLDAVAPGKLCAVGDSNGRSWCALLTCNPAGKPSVEMLLEAGLQIDSHAEPLYTAVMNPHLAFKPEFIAVLADAEKKPSHVLIGRFVPKGMSDYPLLIDLATRTTTVLPIHLNHTAGLVHDGAWYCLGYLQVRDPAMSLFRLAAPECTPHALMENIPRPAHASRISQLFFDQGRWHYLQERMAEWWMAENTTKSFTMMTDTLPGRAGLQRLDHSNHYGLLYYGWGDALYRVEILDK